MKIALFGNPNTGKSSIFNSLTGLNQHVGNFPGVTVDKKTAKLKIDNEYHTLIDFPGSYSIYPQSEDESVVYNVLSNPEDANFPDLALIIVDAANLRRNLFLFTQIKDLGIPCSLILNQWDTLDDKGLKIDLDALKSEFNVSHIVTSNARKKDNRHKLIEFISSRLKDVKNTDYKANNLHSLNQKENIEKEAKERFFSINNKVDKIESYQKFIEETFSSKLDKILTHKIWGYGIFLAVLATIFQFIFSFSSYPMDFIDESFAFISESAANILPSNIFTDLLVNGIIPGLGGVVIFIPQIAFLFLFIGILEESGYMSRVVFLMDKLMRPFGLNGRSVVPMISSVACAIPGIMAARTIGDWKDRIITIMVAPLMSCSARLPVYVLLIALVIPDQEVFRLFNLQGLVLLALYLLGTIAALLVALIMKHLLRRNQEGFLILEMPDYKLPVFRNLISSVFQKCKVFVVDAGKVIMVISILLWALASYGPGDRIENAETTISNKYPELNEDAFQAKVSAYQLENSYIGIMGKTIEPVIKPLGYDWKIGISLICSFAAREAFVGSLATIYSVGDDNEESTTLLSKLKADKNEVGKPIFNLATGLSLMVFYVFAMQCMATLAVVKRETKSWFWPIVQLIYMGILAYSGAFLTHSLFS